MNVNWFKDMAERALATAAEAAIGLWILAGPANLFTVSAAQGAASAGAIAGLSVVKSMLATMVGDPNSASALPASALPVKAPAKKAPAKKAV